MQVSHDRKHLKHLLCRSRRPSPVSSCEGDLGDPLPCAEAVVDGTPPKALLPEAGVNAAPASRSQIWGRPTRRFRGREGCRESGAWGHTATSEGCIAASPNVVRQHYVV